MTNTPNKSEMKAEFARGFFAGLDHIANFINSLDSSAIYSEWRTARAAIAALQAVPAASGEVGWQPIESAPKDGTGVLVICMGAERPTAGEGWFIGGKWTAVCPDVEDEFGEEFYHACTWTDPTHWRPLPEPPAINASGEE